MKNTSLIRLYMGFHGEYLSIMCIIISILIGLLLAFLLFSMEEMASFCALSTPFLRDITSFSSSSFENFTYMG